MTLGTVTTPSALAPLRTKLSLRFETAPQVPSSVRQLNFGHVLDRISSKSSLSTREDFRSLARFEKATTIGQEFSMKELLAFQVKAARLHLRLEACAKIADAVVSSIKRFQSMR